MTDTNDAAYAALATTNATAERVLAELRRRGKTANITKVWPHRFQLEIVNGSLQRTEHFIDKRRFWKNGDRRETWVFGRRNASRYPAADDGSYNVSGMALALIREHERLLDQRAADLALTDRYAAGKALLETFVDRSGGTDIGSMATIAYSTRPGLLYVRLDTHLTLDQTLQLHALVRSFIVSNQQKA